MTPGGPLEDIRRRLAEWRRYRAELKQLRGLERVLFLPQWVIDQHPELCEQTRLAYGYDRIVPFPSGPGGQ